MTSSSRTWLLTDAARRVWVDEFRVGPDSAGLDVDASDWSIRKTRLRGGPCDGVDLVELDNGVFRFSVLPTRGMGVWRGRYRDLDVGWRSPVVGPVHPGLIDLGERGGLGWLSGFDELIVRCGLDSNGAPGVDTVPNNNGVPSEIELTLHGRIANLPASRVEVGADAGGLFVSGEVYETRLFGPQLRLQTTISSAYGSDTIRVSDRVSNLAGVDAEFELLYHCNVGAPFLEAGSRLDVAARRVLPRDRRAAADIDGYRDYRAPTPGYIEQVYWYELLADADGAAQTMLRNAAADKAVALRFNVEQMPAFTQWKNTAALDDGYVTGMEPGTDYPNDRAFERRRGRLQTLTPGETRAFDLELRVLDSAAAVGALGAAIDRLQQTETRRVEREPDPHYSRC